MCVVKCAAFLALLVIFLPAYLYAEPTVYIPAYADLARKLVDDRNITVKTPADVYAKRSALVTFIWGSSGFPDKKLPVSVDHRLSPPTNLKNLARVETLHITMDTGLKGLAYHFIPKQKKRNSLVILHLGHTENCSFNDDISGEPNIGMRRTMNRLLSLGFPVLAVYMPQVTPEDCRWDHERLFSLKTSGNPMKFFLEPTAVSLNYVLKKHPNYNNISMIGLSGGGWTTQVYAAIDTRVKLSVSVAGSLPLYLRWGSSRGDTEQTLDEFYRLAGYLDLYILGAHGSGRKQIQVLNRYDDCCFGEAQHNTAEAKMSFEAAINDYKSKVTSKLAELGAGTFVVCIDEAAPRHMISDQTITKVIIPSLLQL